MSLIGYPIFSNLKLYFIEVIFLVIFEFSFPKLALGTKLGLLGIRVRKFGKFELDVFELSENRVLELPWILELESEYSLIKFIKNIYKLIVN